MIHIIIEALVNAIDAPREETMNSAEFSRLTKMIEEVKFVSSSISNEIFNHYAVLGYDDEGDVWFIAPVSMNAKTLKAIWQEGKGYETEEKARLAFSTMEEALLSVSM